MILGCFRNEIARAETGKRIELVGTFSVELEVGNPAREKFVTVEAMVDTGAIYTMLPEDLLERLGVERLESDVFELARRQPSGIPDRRRRRPACKDGCERCPWFSPAPKTRRCLVQQRWRFSGWSQTQ